MFSTILDLRFQLLYFQEQELFHFYTNISRDIAALFKADYFQLKADLKGKSTNLNISFNELIEDTLGGNNISDNSEDELYMQ